MLQCAYCEVTKKNEAGMSAHIRHTHHNRWKGSLKASLPPEFKMGSPVKAVVGKGKRKPPIPSPCPFCRYSTGHPPALRSHVKREHPDKWRGTLSATRIAAGLPIPGLGRPATLVRVKRRNAINLDLPGSEQERLHAIKKARGAARRAANIAKGLTSGGKPRKRALSRTYIKNARIPISGLPLVCAVCGGHFSSRMSLGTHVRMIHKKSLYDLPPYKITPVETVEQEVDQGLPVLQHFDTAKAEVMEPNGTVITISDGSTTVTIKRDLDLKEVVNQILEQ